MSVRMVRAQDRLRTWIAGRPVIERLTPVGSYRLC